MYLKSNKKIKRTRAKSQFALKVYFIKSIILDIAWDLCDFHKLLGCYVNLIYRNLVSFQLQEQVHNCRKSLKLEKLTDETGTDVMDLYNRLAWEGPRIKEFIDSLTPFVCIVCFCRA